MLVEERKAESGDNTEERQEEKMDEDDDLNLDEKEKEKESEKEEVLFTLMLFMYTRNFLMSIIIAVCKLNV